MINCLIITLICVWVIDLTDFFDEIFKFIWKKIFNNKKPYPYNFDWTKVSPIFHPFFCSLCASFWCNLLYIAIAGQLSFLMLGYICALSFLTPVMKDLLLELRDILTIVVNLRHGK